MNNSRELAEIVLEEASKRGIPIYYSKPAKETPEQRARRKEIYKFIKDFHKYEKDSRKVRIRADYQAA